MAVLECLCGNLMSNAEYPSPFMVEIHRLSTIIQGAAEDKDFNDFDDYDFEYWFCPKCRRITEINNHVRRYSRSFSRVEEAKKPTLAETVEWTELVFHRDEEYFNIQEHNEQLNMKDFLQKYPSRFIVKLSPDERRALVFGRDNQQYICSYLLDQQPDFTNTHSTRGN